MHKLILLFLLISIKSTAQLQKVNLPESKKIGEVQYMGQLIAKISYFESGSDTTYSLLFNNERYAHNTEFVSISFTNTSGILDTLYNILKSGFDLKKGEAPTFILGKDLLSISNEKSMGMMFIKITAINKIAFFYLRKKQLNELFNKK